MVNKVILVGNVGADPEVRTLESGVKVAKIRLATTERVPNKDKSGYSDVTEWHNITLWRNLADVADKYVRKGSQLYLEGKIRTREYTKDNVKCYTTEIVCEELKLLGKREATTQSAPSTSTPQVVLSAEPHYNDDIPY